MLKGIIIINKKSSPVHCKYAEYFLKEVDLLENCITRMSDKAFSIKGWLIACIIGILALMPENIPPYISATILLACSITLWFVNTYFLYLERLYRIKYKWVIDKRKQGNWALLFDLDPHNPGTKEQAKCSKWSAAFSTTVWPFYVIPIFSSIIVIIGYLTQSN